MRISDWSSDVCSSDLLQPQWIADRMALLVGDSCGTRRDAPVPDAARRRARRAVLAAVADALCAAAQPCVDRRGDRRRGPTLRLRALLARSRYRGDVPPDPARAGS